MDKKNHHVAATDGEKIERKTNNISIAKSDVFIDSFHHCTHATCKKVLAFFFCHFGLFWEYRSYYKTGLKK